MARFGFVGPTYSSQSSNADAQRTRNWYVEVDESGQGASVAMLYPTPGTTLFVNLPGEPAVPEMHVINGRVFAAGLNFWEVLANGTAVNRGKLSGSAAKPTIAANNGYQVAVCSGGNVYIFNTQTNLLTTANTGLGPISQIGYCDGYFVALIANSQKFQISALEDGTAWAGADVAQVSVFPDNIVGMICDHRQIWLWGSTRSVVYFNSGSANFPFAPVPGAEIEQGSAAANAQVRLDNTVFWIGGDERGAGVAWRANGYTPLRVSNHCIEREWQSYKTIADAVGFSYQIEGHSFWVIWFPTADKTWVYDVATNMWHEWSFWSKDHDTASRNCCHVFAFGKHLVGDRASGNIYVLSLYTWTDFGSPIRRLRRAPHLTQEQFWMKHKELQIHLEVGVGPEPPLNGTPTGVPYFVMADPTGQQWMCEILDNGQLYSVETAGMQTTRIILQDQAVPGAFYAVGLTAGATGWTTTPVSGAGGGWRNTFPMITQQSGLQAALQVVNSVLESVAGYTVPREPQVCLRYSDDGGHTWGVERTKGIGQVGEYRNRVYWFRLGRSRDRIYELTAMDPVPYRVVDAYLIATPGYGPTDRLTNMLRKEA